MTERGILFTPENYAKCEDGSKTQTRRIVKGLALDILSDLEGEDHSPLSLQSVTGCYRIADDESEPYLYTGMLVALEEYPEEGCIELPCQWGIASDMLYVKEGLEPTPAGNRVQYRRDRQAVASSPLWHWRNNYLSPLHMPKWAARLWLDVVAVRIERLQEITEDDARAEGCAPVVHEDDGAVDCGTRKTTFRHLWESIHGPGSWDINPWVWALEFRKATK